MMRKGLVRIIVGAAVASLGMAIGAPRASAESAKSPKRDLPDQSRQWIA
jgi:hypothetical protein